MRLTPKLLQILKRKKQNLANKHLDPKIVAVCYEDYLKCARANIPLKYWDYELTDLDRANAHIQQKIAQYCDNFEEALNTGMGLFLVGNNGTGKTLTASLILKKAIQAGYSARFTSLNEIMSLISLYDKEAHRLFKEEILEVDFLVIDDITKTYKNFEKQTSTYIDLQLDTVIRSRANLNLPIIITSNHKKEEALKSVDEVLSNSLLSLFSEHLKELVFLGEDRRKL